MPTVATQTEFSMTSETGYLDWLKKNRDIADGIPCVKEHSPKYKLTQLKKKWLFKVYNSSQVDK
jgi:hypothetical protein